jgi:predicted Rossmann-fold nucleotide-binding protein
MTKKKDPLVGKYFHSVLTDRETISWQGQITARIGDSYLLQLFEWIMGGETNQTLMPAAEMNYWRIYDSAEEMNHHYKKYAYNQEAKEARQERDAAAGVK